MTRIVGILNITSDSFSGDGVLGAKDASARVDAMIADGASVIDIGAESTRPGAQILSPQEEWQRLEPVAKAVRARKGEVEFSVDTRHVEIAAKALESGFSWINDVSGGEDSGMFKLAKASGCKLALMHSLTIPADPSRILDTTDPVGEVVEWGRRALEQADKAGLARRQIVLDPGIGFGKSPEQSLALVKDIGRLKALGAAVLVGHSRKSFLRLFTGKPAAERDPETLAFSCYLAEQGVDYLRVHDVKSHAAMLRIRGAL